LVSEIDESNKKTLVGSFFLGDAKHPWLGRVLEALGERGTYYYVECFASKATDVQSRRVISIHTMSDWAFYGTVYQMRKNLVEAQGRWQQPAAMGGEIHEFFQDMLNIELERMTTGEQIFEAWTEWRRARK
jgi:hypothetical protein